MSDQSKSSRYRRGHKLGLSASLSPEADAALDRFLDKVSARSGVPNVDGERSRLLRTLFAWYEEALLLGIDPLEFVDKMEKAKKKRSK